MNANELVAALKATEDKAQRRFIEALETNYCNFHSAVTSLRWSYKKARCVQLSLQVRALQLGAKHGALR